MRALVALVSAFFLSAATGPPSFRAAAAWRSGARRPFEGPAASTWSSGSQPCGAPLSERWAAPRLSGSDIGLCLRSPSSDARTTASSGSAGRRTGSCSERGRAAVERRSRERPGRDRRDRGVARHLRRDGRRRESGSADRLRARRAPLP